MSVWIAASLWSMRRSFDRASAWSRSRSAVATKSRISRRRSGPISGRASSASARLAAWVASAQGVSSPSGAARARPSSRDASCRRRPRLATRRLHAGRALVRQPQPAAAAQGRQGEQRRGQAGHEQATLALLGGAGLGPRLGQLGLPEPLLHAGQVGGQGGDDHARVPRPVLRRGGQAGLRQRDQLGLGAAGVEPGQGLGQVGPLRLAVDLVAARPA